MGKVTPSCRVALKNDSYTLHKILPNKVEIERKKNVFSFHVLSRLIRSLA